MSSSRDVAVALTNARLAVEEHVALAAEVGISWQEETASEVLWVRARPNLSGRPIIKVADFSKSQEGKVGADWLWWFVFPDGECFGLLVQAKRLKHHNDGTPEMDLYYNEGKQLSTLLAAARKLGVAAAHVLYFGPVANRGLVCEAAHANPCELCRRRSVAITSALRAAMLFSPSKSFLAAQSFQNCIPLEDLVDPAGSVQSEFEPSEGSMSEELRRFLVEDQSGARLIARKVYQLVIRPDDIMLATPVAEKLEISSDCVFQDLPLDMLHFPEPFFPHVLRGLRRQLPSYVREILADEPPRLGVEVDDLAGVVVIEC